jgi:copper chaperone CopZ
MKYHVYLVLIAFAIATGCATTEMSKSTGDDLDLSSVQEAVMTVHGLSCPLCSNNLDGQLRQIDGVEAATIDLKTGAVTVELREGHAVTTQKLAAAVKEAGFTFKGIEPKVDE